MANMSDYANLLLALTTLAKAPVARYPTSGPFQLAEQGQDVARGKLADEALKKAQKKAKKKSGVAGIAQIAGTGVGYAVGGPIGAAVGGQLGSYAAGGSVDPAAVAEAFAESKSATESAAGYGELTKRRDTGGAAKKRKMYNLEGLYS